MGNYQRSIIITVVVCFNLLAVAWWNKEAWHPPPGGSYTVEPLRTTKSYLTQPVTRFSTVTESDNLRNTPEEVNKREHTGIVKMNKLDIKSLVDPFMIGCRDEPTKPGLNIIRILLWPGRNNWHCMGNSRSTCHTGYGNFCQFSYSPKSFHASDVVIVDAFQTKLSPVNIIEKRSHHQKFIYHQHEAPYIAWNFGLQHTQYNFTHAFNVTSTFAFDSDVPFWEETEVILHMNKTKQMELESENINYAANKTRMVSWFVSNCNTQSQREKYVKELQKFIPVDIMGSCGNKSIGCGRRMNYANCDSIFLSKYYKFYLAFENSICQDYVTEKLWRIVANMQANVIPIVLGGANYTKLLPPKTYIDVKDFDSPEELSKLLHSINDNDDMYNEYIRNKKAIIQQPVPFMFGSKSATYASRLCEHLHAKKEQLSKIGTSGDAQEYWNEGKMCKTLSQFLNQTYS